MSELSNKRILFIDSSSQNTALFKQSMNKEGYTVDHVASGTEGVSLYNRSPYPLVVVNNHIEDMSGLEVCRQLAIDPEEPALILITDPKATDVISEALVLGVQKCLPLEGDHIYQDILPIVVTRLSQRRDAAKRALDIEKELRLNEQRFLQAEIMSHSCNWESDNSLSQWVYASANTKEMLGVSLDDLLGDYANYLQFIHLDDRGRISKVYEDAADAQEGYEAQYRFCRPDGTVLHLLEQAAPIMNDSGGIAFYRGTTRDITPQVDAESRYRTVVENAVEAIITINSEGIIQTFNQAAVDQFQYSPDEVIGQNVSILMPENDAEHHDSYLQRYLSTRKARVIGLGREVTAKRRDGTAFPAFLSVSEHDIGGKVSFTGLIRDISAQKETEEQLIQAKNEAERANRAKSEFLSSMSHELRTPLNAVLGFAQMLEYNPQEPLSDKQQESVDLIKRGGRHLLNLINEVLELAKIESGRIDLSIETIDLANAIEECASIAEATAMDRQIELTNLAASKTLPKIRADNTRLKQILLNLLSNAVKYNKAAGSITIDAEAQDSGYVRISVNDTGIGLSEREQRKIFEPFERLGKQTEDVEGTGIGLTITRQLVTLMNGHMGFESELGEGSTFWIDLPEAKDEKSAKPTDTKHPRRRSSDTFVDLRSPIGDPGTSYLVLYVEDNTSNIILMNNIFASIPNATLQVTETARSGIEYAKKHQPDVILMDINLPGMDGVEATKILQRKKETRGIPVIAISASIWRAKNGVSEDVSFYRYIEKPFEINEVCEFLNEALNGQSQ